MQQQARQGLVVCNGRINLSLERRANTRRLESYATQSPEKAQNKAQDPAPSVLRCCALSLTIADIYIRQFTLTNFNMYATIPTY